MGVNMVFEMREIREALIPERHLDVIAVHLLPSDTVNRGKLVFFVGGVPTPLMYDQCGWDVDEFYKQNKHVWAGDLEPVIKALDLPYHQVLEKLNDDAEYGVAEVFDWRLKNGV